MVRVFALVAALVLSLCASPSVASASQYISDTTRPQESLVGTILLVPIGFLFIYLIVFAFALVARHKEYERDRRLKKIRRRRQHA